MASMKDYLIPGISAAMLYPGAFADETAHERAVELACDLPDYELFELFFPEDPYVLAREMVRIRRSGKSIILNLPAATQQDGPLNPSSDDPAVRRQALALVLRHIDYAAEFNAPAMVYTASADKGDAARPELIERFFDYACAAAQAAARHNMLFMLEPIERHRFKRLFLGPTKECADFVLRLQRAGHSNARLMIDMAHLPLMEESCEEALGQSLEAGLSHVHIGNAVLDQNSPFYGHTHPPLGLAEGLFGQAELAEQLRLLFKHGYFGGAGKRAHASYEVSCSPGKTPAQTAAEHYAKLEAAFATALAAASASK